MDEPGELSISDDEINPVEKLFEEFKPIHLDPMPAFLLVKLAMSVSRQTRDGICQAFEELEDRIGPLPPVVIASPGMEIEPTWFHWSTKKPAAAGFYWYESNTPEIAEVYSNGSQLYAILNHHSCPKTVSLEFLKGRWAGPIPAPIG